MNRVVVHAFKYWIAVPLFEHDYIMAGSVSDHIGRVALTVFAMRFLCLNGNCDCQVSQYELKTDLAMI